MSRFNRITQLLTLIVMFWLMLVQSPGQSAMANGSSGGPAGTRSQGDSMPCSSGDNSCRIGHYCFAAGHFSASIMQMSDGASGNYRRIRLNLRFQNLTDHEVTLAYHAGTSTITDDLGNTYSCCKAGGGPDTSAKGIGTNQDGKTDAQFTLDAHGADVATFEVWGIRNGKEVPEAFHYDLTMDEMDFKNPKLIIRQRALLFRDFNAKTKFDSE